MSIDSPDDDYSSDYPLDPEWAVPLDTEERELLAKLPKPRKQERMPRDLRKLREAINDVKIARIAEKSSKVYDFEGYEALDTKVGRMGLVIKAREPEFERMVAIKFWKRPGPKAEAALLAEAKTLAKLSHPHVVAVHKMGTWQQRTYIVMEWIEGLDGHEWLADRRIWHTVREVFIQAGEGLAAAHDAGIVHRDFKPANLLIGKDGWVRVADFGVAERVDGDQAGEVVIAGTPCYMAPERLRGEPGDARADQYSFCAAMWRALHGVQPYPGESRQELLAAIEAGELTTGQPVEPIPAWLDRIVRKGLEVDPDRRYANMHELLDALAEEPPASEEDEEGAADEVFANDGERVLHAPVGRPDPDGGWRWGSVLIGVCMMAIGLLLGWTLWAPSTSAPVARDPASTSQRSARPDLLGPIAQDIQDGDFAGAKTKWLENRGSLSYWDNLSLGSLCLAEVERFRERDRDRALNAFVFGWKVADHVEHTASQPLFERGGQQLKEQLTAARPEADGG